jgi:hypothetical protein
MTLLMALIHNASPGSSDLRDQDVVVKNTTLHNSVDIKQPKHTEVNQPDFVSFLFEFLTTQYPSCLFAVDSVPFFFLVAAIDLSGIQIP